jgi:hypothetical protein
VEGTSMPSVSTAYGSVVLPLGFRFDVDAVLVDEVAHRRDCECLARPIPGQAVSIAAAGICLGERCPRACPRCRPGFETLLSYQFDTGLAAGSA